MNMQDGYKLKKSQEKINLLIYTEGNHETRFRGKKDILTKVTEDRVQYW